MASKMCLFFAGMAGGLRASGPKADLALIVADEDAVAAGVFTTNVMCAAPVTYCKQVLAKNKPARAVSYDCCFDGCLLVLHMPSSLLQKLQIGQHC